MSGQVVTRSVRQVRAPFVKAAKFSRGCVRCRTDFFTTEFNSPERGIWRDMKWWCSAECAPELPAPNPEGNTK